MNRKYIRGSEYQRAEYQGIRISGIETDKEKIKSGEHRKIGHTKKNDRQAGLTG